MLVEKGLIFVEHQDFLRHFKDLKELLPMPGPGEKVIVGRNSPMGARLLRLKKKWAGPVEITPRVLSKMEG